MCTEDHMYMMCMEDHMYMMCMEDLMYMVHDGRSLFNKIRVTPQSHHNHLLSTDLM